MLSNLPGEIVDIDLLLEYSQKAAASLTQIILDTHRKKHCMFLLAEMNQQEDNSNNNIDQQEVNNISEIIIFGIILLNCCFLRLYF